MARVTVEDCVEKIDNRFKLVLLSAHRARLIAGGATLTVDRDRDKNPVVALREIAEGTITPDDLEEEFVTAQQKYVEVDEPETEAVPLLAGTAAPAASAPDTDVTFDRMSEDEMLAGLEALVPPAPSDDEEG